MNPRINLEMSEEDLEKLLEACKPTLAIKIGNYTPASPQENANRAWQALGAKMGFDFETACPIRNKGNRFFSAIPMKIKK